MTKERSTDRKQELARELESDMCLITGRFDIYYQETDFLDKVAGGIVLDSHYHGALDDNLSLLVPQKISDKVVELIDPGYEYAEAWRYVYLKDHFYQLFDETGSTGAVEGLTREMYDAWQKNVDRLVAEGMEKVTCDVTNRETDGGIDYREAAKNVFMQLLEVDSEVDYSGKSIVLEVSNNLGDSTTPSTFMSVMSWMKETPGLGYQYQLTGGFWWIKDKLRGPVASELSIDMETMNKIVDKVEKSPGLLVEIAPAIGKVITTYRTHGGKSAMVYLLQVGEWAQQEIDGTMELPLSLRRPDFYEYFAKKIIDYKPGAEKLDNNRPISEVIFNRSLELKKTLKGEIYGDVDRLLQEGYILPGCVYKKIYENPSVVTKLIPWLKSMFGYADRKVAISVLLVADAGQKNKTY